MSHIEAPDIYILSSELLLLLAVWFVPPLLVSSFLQFAMFKRTGIWKAHRLIALGAIFATVTLSPVLGLLALQLPLPMLLGVPGSIWLLPLAFVIVFVVARLSSKLASRVAHLPAS